MMDKKQEAKHARRNRQKAKEELTQAREDLPWGEEDLTKYKSFYGVILSEHPRVKRFETNWEKKGRSGISGSRRSRIT